MSKKNALVVARTGRLLEAANGFIAARLKNSALADLQPCHGDMLFHIHQNPGIKVTELSLKTHRTKSTTSVLCDKLVALGYIEKRKCAQDPRAFELYLTEQATKRWADMERISSELNETLLRGFSDEEAELLESLLERARANFDPH